MSRLPRGRVAAVAALVVCAACADAPPLEPGRSFAPRVSPRAAPAPSAPAPPAPEPETCGDTGEGFDVWLAAFESYAVGQGVSRRAASVALGGLTYDPEVIAQDRSQRSFKLSFEAFAAKRITRARLARGRDLLRKHASLFAALEARYGVPPPLLVAIWGTETDYGANVGTLSTLRCLATLAYDCRRPARFRAELLAALRLVERGDLAPHELVGAWAGELGQTQFLPSSYERYAVDFDGDGRANLVASHADALASTASYLKGHGWRAGEPFHEGSENARVLAEWNASPLVRKTLALFAERLVQPAPR